MHFLSFHVDKRTSPLDGITCYEIVDRRTLYKLRHSKLMKETYSQNDLGIVIGTYDNERTQIDHYLKLMDTRGRIPVVSRKGRNNPYGRSNPVGALSLFTIRRQIRHTLAGKKMLDIDIKNAHLIIMLQICKAEGVSCPELEYYVLNRDEFLQFVIDTYNLNPNKDNVIEKDEAHDIAKRFFIIALYGGSFKTWYKGRSRKEGDVRKVSERPPIDVSQCPEEMRDPKDPTKLIEHPRMKKFRMAMREIQSLVLEANPDVARTIAALKEQQGIESYNDTSTVTSFVLQEYELRCLEAAYGHLCRSGVIVDNECVLCADGIMVPRENVRDIPALLVELSEAVKEHTGFDLTFTQKEMDQGYDDETIERNIRYDIMDISSSETSLAEFFVMTNDNFLSSNKKLHHFNGTYWKPCVDTSQLHNEITGPFKGHVERLFSKLVKRQRSRVEKLTKAAKEDESVKSELREQTEMLKTYEKRMTATLDSALGSSTRIRSIITEVIARATNNSIIFDNNPFLFAFDNAVFNLETNTFIEPDRNQYITKTTGWSYNQFYDNRRVDELRKLQSQIFAGDSKATGDYYLTAVSTGLYGCTIPHIFILSGEGGNGKSMYDDLAEETMGEYCSRLAPGQLQREIKDGPNPEMASLDKVRLTIAIEPPSNQRINASTLKTLTSGDGKLKVRDLYDSNALKNPKLTLFLECNDQPMVSEVTEAIRRRVRIIPFKSSFRAADEYDLLTEEEKNNGRNFRANPYYTSAEFKRNYRQAFFEILREHWVEFQKNNYTMPTAPPECKLATDMYLSVSDDLMPWFNSVYEPGDPNKDFVEVGDVFERFSNTEAYKLLSKIDRRRYNKSNFLERIMHHIILKQHLRLRDTFFDGIRHKKPYLVGFRERVEEEDCDDDDDNDNDNDNDNDSDNDNDDDNNVLVEQFNQWFSGEYATGDANKHIVYVKDVYTYFQTSQWFTNLSKIEKRHYNLANFYQMVANHPSLREAFRRRDTYACGVWQKKPYLIGFCDRRFFGDDDDNDDDNDNEDNVDSECHTVLPKKRKSDEL